MDFKKSTNAVKMKKDKWPDYLMNNYFFCQFFYNISALLLCKLFKKMFLTSSIWLIFIQFLLHQEILKFWLY